MTDESVPSQINQESKSSSPRNNNNNINQDTELIKNDSNMNIQDYVFENKDVETVCENFIESLFLVNPKNFDSLGQSHLKIRKLADSSRSNLQSSAKKFSMNNSSNAQSKKKLNKELLNNLSECNSNRNNDQKIDSDSLRDQRSNENEKTNKIDNNFNPSNSSLNNVSIKKLNISPNMNIDSEKENNSNLANSRNTNRQNNNSGSSSGRVLICQNFVNDLFFPKNNNFLTNEHGDELNKIEIIQKKEPLQKALMYGIIKTM